MASDFELGQGDTLPIIECTLLSDGAPLPNLTNPGVTIRFHMWRGSDIVVDAPAVIDDATNAIVHYDWQTGDTADVGKYQAEWEVTFAPGKILTIPRKPKISIEITAQGA